MDVKIRLRFEDMASGALGQAAAKASGIFAGLKNGANVATAGVAGAFGLMATGVGKAMGSAGNLLMGAVNTMKNGLTSLVSHAKWASLLIGGPLVLGITELVGMAGKFERFGKAAEFMLGSKEAADQFADSVRRLSKETMFNVDQIAEMESRLVGNTKNVQKSEGALRALTDAVAATGGGYAELDGATRAYIQVNSKAILSSEELNRQFANSNIPIVRLLAESIAKDLNHPLRKYIQNTAGSGGAAGATKKLAGEYEKAIAKQGEWGLKFDELGAKVTKAKDKFGESSVEFRRAQYNLEEYGKTVDKAKGTIAAFNSAEANKGKGGGVAKAMSVEEIQAQLQSIGDLSIPGGIGADAITRALNEAYGGANKELLKSFSGQMSLLGDVAKLTALSFLGLDESFRPVEGGVLSLLKNALYPMVNFLDQNQEKITNFAKQFGNSMPGLLAFASFIGGILIPFLWGLLAPVIATGVVFGLIGYAVGLLIERFGGFGAILGTAQTIWTNLATLWTGTVLPALQFLGNSLKTLLGPSLEQLKPAIDNLVVAFQKMFPILMQAVGIILIIAGAIITGLIGAFAMALPYIIGAVTAIINIFRGFLMLFVGLFTWNAQMINDGWKTLWTGVEEFLGNTINAILAAITGFVFGIISFFEMLYNKLVGHSIIPDLVNGILEWFGTLKERGLNAISSLINGIKDRFLSVVNSAGNWGRDIVSNFINGLKSSISALGGAATVIADKMGLGDLFKLHGGIVPGPVGAPVPIIAHGGERVVPRSGVDAQGPTSSSQAVTVNFYGNVAMDDESRVNELADRIGKILGRQNELARYGAGY